MYQVATDLWTSSRPRGGDWLEIDVNFWARHGVEQVVSCLCPDEEKELLLEDEKQLCEDAGIAFHRLPVVDRTVPEASQFLSFIDMIHAKQVPTLVHCRMGIGRATLVAGALLVRDGLDPVVALSRVETARGLAVPDTEEQRLWFLDLF